MANVIKSDQYLHDLSAISTYIAEQSGSRNVVRNFLVALDLRLEHYARQPQMGTPCEDLIDDLRCFTLKKNYIVYYREIDNGIDVLRVLHSARNIDLTDFI